MTKPHNALTQEVPTGFRYQLKALHDDHDPRLNAVLAAARSGGWRTATLAGIVGITEAACSKRIERASAPAPDLVARQSLRSAARKMSDAGWPAIAAVAVLGSEQSDPVEWLTKVIDRIEATDIDQQAGWLRRKIRSALRDLVRARDYEQAPQVDITGIEIPEPRRIQAMMNGRRLPLSDVEKLRNMKTVASRVNGAMAADHPDREVSESYTRQLNDLISQQGYTPYYLAKELGVTHRAITSRLERHGFRPPCPSVAGTPSGVYRGRKIGDSTEAEDK